MTAEVRRKATELIQSHEDLHRRRFGPQLLAGRGSVRALLALVVLVVAIPVRLAADTSVVSDLDHARALLAAGKYADCEMAAAAAIEEENPAEEWFLLRLRAQLATGNYAGALETLETALAEHRSSIRLRWWGQAAYRHNGQVEKAAEALDEIEGLVRRSPWRYRDPAHRVLLGRFLLRRGADAREVLEKVYDRVKKERSDFVQAYVASGDLALEKSDFGVALQEFQRALEISPEDPDILFRLARAQVESDPASAEDSLNAALARNPNHVDSLLWLIDRAIDREDYGEAEQLVARVLEIHPTRHEAMAYRAVLAHVRGDAGGEKAARDLALSTWPTNPEVDHIIGRKLSQKYRFAEGAAYQRRALELDGDFLPARMQLAQDLLRLGREEEGWRLVDEVYERDAYNVVAHNLDILHEHLSGFRTLEAEGLLVRMDPGEAEIYGEAVLELLRRARATLCARYDVELTAPVVVEIFPEQKDFAIRTFGLPGGSGFLGVCFGSVITANSPASQGESPSNWQAVLWHEFCHVVTLHKTRNRMPRWLSEGISVYEEREANPAWGQSMSPGYLEIIEAGGLTPVSELSGAFLRPPSPLHLDLAYYESSLVVEFIVERHGFDTLGHVLSDLAEGTPINEVLARRVGSLPDLDREAEAFIRSRAETLASKANWERPELPPGAGPSELEAWLLEHPRSFWGLQQRALALMSSEDWDRAREPLERMLDLCPEYIGSQNAYELLAAVHRQLGDVEAERAVLQRLASRDADAVGSFLRLLEISQKAEDWETLAATARRLLAVNPLLGAPHRALTRAAEELGRAAEAVASYRALLRLDPVAPADLHFRLGRLLRELGDLDGARRELLRAIEEAPRFRAAYRELLAVARERERGGAEPGKPAGLDGASTSGGDGGTEEPESGKESAAGTDADTAPEVEAGSSPPDGSGPAGSVTGEANS